MSLTEPVEPVLPTEEGRQKSSAPANVVAENSRDWSLTEETKAQREPVIEQQSVERRNRKPRRWQGISLACSIFLTVVGGILYSVLSSSDGIQPSRLASLVSIGLGIASVVVLGLSFNRDDRKMFRLYDGLPILGVVMYTVAVGSFLALEIEGGVPPLLATAPVFSAAAMWFGRSAISSRSSSLDTLSTSEFAGSSRGYFGSVSGVDSKEGARFSLAAGDVLSVDVRVEVGSLAVDETLFSTVPTFKVKDEEDIIPAGSTVLSGKADVISLSDRSSSSANQMEQALGADITDAIDGLRNEDANPSKWTCMLLCFIGIASAIFWSERSDSPVIPLLACGSVFMFGCILQLVQVLYRQRRMLVLDALSKGVVIRKAGTCRTLAQIDTVEIDPSRLQSDLLPRVVDFQITDDRLEKSAFCNFILSLLGRAEDRNLLAFANYLRREVSVPSTERVVDLKEYADSGICGTVHGVELSVGSESFLVERGIMVQPSDLNIDDSEGYTLILVALDDDVVAFVQIRSDQEDLIGDGGGVVTPQGVTVKASPGVSRRLEPTTLLVRGRESDVVSVDAPFEEAVFAADKGQMPPVALVSLTAAVDPLIELVDAFKVEARAVERFRMMVGCLGLGLVVSTLLGFYWPITSVIGIVVAQITLGLSMRVKP